MVYITSTGRVVTDIDQTEKEDYLTRLEYPKPEITDNKIGVITGIDKSKDEILYTYIDVPPTPEPEKPPLTEVELAILGTAINTEYLVILAEMGF